MNTSRQGKPLFIRNGFNDPEPAQAWIGAGAASMLQAFFVFGIILAGSLRAETPALLQDALLKERNQQFRWAFTETMEVHNGKGKIMETSVIRYDPSKPYAEQYAPISIDGKQPSNSKIQECRERGEDEARKRQKQFEEGQDEDAPEIELNHEKGIVELQQAFVQEENEQVVTYRVPVRAKTKSKYPFDKVEVLVRVDKAEHTLAGIQLTLNDPVRVNLVAKLRGAAIYGCYDKVDASYPPQITTAEVQANISFLFAKVKERVLIKRSDFKHVKPYDERFVVKTGPLKSLGF